MLSAALHGGEVKAPTVGATPKEDGESYFGVKLNKAAFPGLYEDDSKPEDYVPGLLEKLSLVDVRMEPHYKVASSVDGKPRVRPAPIPKNQEHLFTNALILLKDLLRGCMIRLQTVRWWLESISSRELHVKSVVVKSSPVRLSRQKGRSWDEIGCHNCHDWSGRWCGVARYRGCGRGLACTRLIGELQYPRHAISFVLE
jgi:hypothetical protein